jgi:hypothetical protein
MSIGYYLNFEKKIFIYMKNNCQQSTLSSTPPPNNHYNTTFDPKEKISVESRRQLLLPFLPSFLP